MRLIPIGRDDWSLLREWLTPQMIDLIAGDDLFDTRKPFFILIIRDNQDQPVGFFSVYNIDDINHKCEVGTVIAVPSGHRVGVRAIKKLLGTLFTQGGMHRVYMKPLSRNERAVKAAMHIGFIVEGVERDSVFRNGKFESLTILSLLKEDFERRWS
jgi:RimJ/RimL family protein N-acetyltransferase